MSAIAAAAVSAGLLTFGSGFLIYRAVCNSHDSMPVAPSINLETSLNPKYHVVRVLSEPVERLTWTNNAKDLDSDQPINQVIEMQADKVRYIFELRLSLDNAAKLHSSDASASEPVPAINTADLIEVWCPNSMTPLVNAELIEYSGGANPVEYKAAFSAALSVEKARKLFAIKDNEVPIHKSAEISHDLEKIACPQLAPRPVPVETAYHSTARGYRCNVNLEGAISPHKVALSIDVYDTNAPRIGYKDYPKREVLDDEVSWSVSSTTYTPKYYMSDWLISRGWSHAFFPLTDRRTAQMPFTGMVDIIESENDFHILTYPKGVDVEFDSNGFPINPCGRTGLTGRGLLGVWGPNSASDPVVTRSVKRNINGVDKYIVEVLLISRPEPVSDEVATKKLAIPGGMTDLIAYEKVKKISMKLETGGTTAGRELAEETGMVMDFKTHPDVTTIYKGYSDDPRNTDNAWMQTEVIWKHLSYMRLYENDVQLNEHRRATRFLYKISGDLKDNKICGNETLLNIYLDKSLPANVDVSTLSEEETSQYGNCLLLNSESGTCAQKIKDLTGIDLTMENKNKYYSLGLLQAYAGHKLSDLQRLDGWDQAFQRMKNLATLKKVKNTKINVSDDAVAMEVLLDALAYIMKTSDFEGEQKGEVEGQDWVSLDDQISKEPEYFFAMHAYFIRRLAQYVNYWSQDSTFHAK